MDGKKLVDTGGIALGKDVKKEIFSRQIREQAMQAASHSSIVIFMVDATEGTKHTKKKKKKKRDHGCGQVHCKVVEEGDDEGGKESARGVVCKQSGFVRDLRVDEDLCETWSWNAPLHFCPEQRRMSRSTRRV